MIYFFLLSSLYITVLISFMTIRQWSDIWIFFVSFIAGIVVLVILYFFLLWIFSIFVSSKKTYGRPSNFYYNVMNKFYKLVCEVSGLKIHVTGKEKVDPSKKVLFVCNHLSMLDPMVLSIIFNDMKIAFITKVSNYKVPIGGKFARRACYIPIDRENPKNALESIHMAENLIKNDITSIAVYPEGHRGNSYKMDPFKTGVFMIAMKTNSPVVVCTIYGTQRSIKKSIFRNINVYFDVLDVVNVDGKSSKDLSMKAFDMMQNNLNMRNGDNN